MHRCSPRYRPYPCSSDETVVKHRYIPQSQCTIHYECTGRRTCTDARQSENIHLCELSSHIPHFSFYWYQSTSSQSVKSLREKIKMHRCSPRYRPVSLSFWWNNRKLLGIFPKASVPYITNVHDDAHERTLASVKTFIYANWVESHSSF